MLGRHPQNWWDILTIFISNISTHLNCSFTNQQIHLWYVEVVLHRDYMFRRHLRHLQGRLLSPFIRNSLRVLQGQDPQGTGDKLNLLVQ
jgi:hypothetical protein